MGGVKRHRSFTMTTSVAPIHVDQPEQPCRGSVGGAVFGGRVDRETHRKGCPASDLGRDVDLAAEVPPNDVMHDGKTEPLTFAHIFGGEHWIENLGEHTLRDAL